MVHSHHVYKKVWLPIIGEQLVLENEPANPRDEVAVALIKDSRGPHSESLFTDHMAFYYTKGLCCLSYYWEEEER